MSHRLREEQERAREIRVAGRRDDLGARQRGELAGLHRQRTGHVLRVSLQDVERVGAGAGALGGIDDLGVLAGDHVDDGAEAGLRLVCQLQSRLVELEGVVRGVELVISVVPRGVVVGGRHIAGFRDAGVGQELRQRRGRGIGRHGARRQRAGGRDQRCDVDSLQQRLLHWGPSGSRRMSVGGRLKHPPCQVIFSLLISILLVVETLARPPLHQCGAGAAELPPNRVRLRPRGVWLRLPRAPRPAPVS